MKKAKIIVVTAFVTAIVCAIAAFIVVTEVYQPNVIGQTVSETVEVTDANGTVTGKNITSYVFLGANSKLYEDEDATTSHGIFLDTFEDGELAELIDNNQFPYQQEYVAVTSSSDPVRYMIKTADGSTYWVEP